MKFLRMMAVAGVALAEAAPSGHAAPKSDESAQEAVGLFNRFCLEYVGRTNEMRAALDRLAILGVRRLSPQMEDAFFHGGNGAAYDASNAVGRLVVFSLDEMCTVSGDGADGGVAISELETMLAKRNILFEPIEERDPPTLPDRHLRHYAVTIAGVPYTLVLVAGPAGRAVQAMISISPAKPDKR